jgi:hypothetical protein
VQVLVSWLSAYSSRLTDLPRFDVELFDSNNRLLAPATPPAMKGGTRSVAARVMLTRTFNPEEPAQQPALLRVHFDHATVYWDIIFDQDRFHLVPQ